MNIDKVQITNEEIKQFEAIDEKRNALRNLIFICENNELLRNEDLYSKFLTDISKTENERTQLWNDIMDKYNIHDDEHHELELDFQSGIITCVPKS